MLLYTIHEVFEDHLVDVAKEMETMGSPNIRVVNIAGEYWQAIEGTHRLAAACKLGIPVHFEVIESDELIAADSLDVDHGYFCPGEDYSGAEIAGELWPSDAKGAIIYNVNEANILCQIN